MQYLRPPALLECIFSLSASPGLVVTLANVPSNKCESAEESIAESLLLLKSATTSIESWRVNKLGGQLIKSLISSLESPNCSDASRSMILDVVDNILEHASSSSSLASSTSTQPPSSVNDGDPKQTDMVTLVLGPWLEDLLVALKTVVSSVWEGGASLRPPSLHGKGNKGKKGSHHHATRELSVLERLGSRVESPSVAVHLGDALCALVTSRRAKGGGGGSARLDERGLTRAMAAMAALWNKAPDLSLSAPPLSSSSPSSANGAVVIDEGRMRTYCESLAMLTVRLSSREARQALAASYQSAARLLPEASESAALLADLCSWSPSHIEEVSALRLTPFSLSPSPFLPDNKL